MGIQCLHGGRGSCPATTTDEVHAAFDHAVKDFLYTGNHVFVHLTKSMDGQGQQRGHGSGKHDARRGGTILHEVETPVGLP